MVSHIADNHTDCFMCNRETIFPRLAIYLKEKMLKVTFCSNHCLKTYQRWWLHNDIKEKDSLRVRAIKNAHKKRTACWLEGEVMVEERAIENFLPIVRDK